LQISFGGTREINNGVALTGLAVALLLSVEGAGAEDKEPIAVVALGPAGEWGFEDRCVVIGRKLLTEL